ncbi:helix-turn-helix domain-containing protein [Halorussus gelatinilyticus]|uniref:Helix-turn-helix domain-containing protein n=1 Tax=Halorussus gelatinilyticus TaxID=2937524 RepID=A0A8U0IKV5_9EURY|nr:helix-turn-helix domain-containing protein [Halorussus gelatinilyticus]UPW00679.1 helix-turn-helix domain-containing protein [Halorussus gelatinilyticus]
MKYLTLTLRQPRETRHPMQNFIADSPAVAREELLAWNILREASVEYLLFYVEGDLDPYRTAIAEVDSIPEYTLVPIDSRSFYAYVHQETRETDTDFRSVFARRQLLVVPPIEYTGEGHMRFTLIGAPEDLRSLLDELPERIAADVEEVGDYDRRHGTVAGGLTDRQFEAASVAARLGYYEVPREASLADVADELDCAESTASNLLRKAEASVMRRIVGE